MLLEDNGWPRGRYTPKGNYADFHVALATRTKDGVTGAECSRNASFSMRFFALRDPLQSLEETKSFEGFRNALNNVRYIADFLLYTSLELLAYAVNPYTSEGEHDCFSLVEEEKYVLAE